MKKRRVHDENQTPAEFPMRLNKYLAHEGYTTRRGADELIEKKRVLLNGRIAVLGDKVNEGDAVEVRDGGKPKEYIYFAYNKPVGVLTYTHEPRGKDIRRSLPKSTIPGDVFPIGRLDKESHGLLILTNDGRVTDRLLNPVHTHDKEYIVKTKDRMRDSFKEHMEAGVQIEEEKTKPCRVKILGEKTFAITLTEGKKHQIRRMVVAMHNEVADLQRVRIMNVKLGNLALGTTRPITGEELDTFLADLGL